MIWKVEVDERARREPRKLDQGAQKRILDFLRGRIATKESPRRIGQSLTGRLTGLWCYRVGAWRLICRIEDERVVVLLLRIGHRREVYRR